MRIKRLLFLLVVIVWMTNVQNVQASHSRGGDLSYECLPGNQYRVTLTLYRDCNGVSLPSSTAIDWETTPVCFGAGTGSFVVNRVSIEDISPVCAGGPTSCGGGTGGVGIERHVYVGNFTVLSSCNTIRFSYRQCCRNNTVTNLMNPGSERLYFDATVLDHSNGCNNSPVFFNEPMAFGCIGEPLIYNNGAIDPDGDSLAYSLVPCLDDLGNPVTYVAAGFSGTSPFGPSDPVTLDPVTGVLSFTPSANHVGVLCILIEEYSGGLKVGESVRDMQYEVFSCTNQTPIATGVNGATGGGASDYVTSVCAGVPFCFDIFANDPNISDSIFMKYNNSIPNASLNVQENGSPNQLTGTFCWTPTASDIGEHQVQISVKDNGCPFETASNYVYTINVAPNPEPPVDAGPDLSICEGQTVGLTATTASANASTYEWSPAGLLDNPNIPNPNAFPSVTTAFTVTLTYLSGCTSVDHVTVEVHENPTVGVHPKNINVCGGLPITLTGGTDVNGRDFHWNDLNTGLPGFPKFPANSTGTVSGTSSAINFQMYTDPGAYAFSLDVIDPITGCSSSETISLTVGAASAPSCNNIYVSTAGIATNPGTQTAPTTLKEALRKAGCNNTVIKMATGTYFIDSVINIRSYMTLEGGFLENSNWIKTSAPGATEIRRNNNNPIGIPNVNQRIVGVQAVGSVGFRLQDLTITTDDLPPNVGWTNYGVYLNNASDYHITRVRVIAGNGSSGISGAPGCGRFGPLGTHPMDGKDGDGGLIGNSNGTNIIGGNGANAGGAGGVCTYPVSGPSGGTGGSIIDQGNGVGHGGNGGQVAGIPQGGAGGGGGRGALGNAVGDNGGNGGFGGGGGALVGPTGFCSTTPTGLGAPGGPGNGGTSQSTNGTDGTNGNVGPPGSNGCPGTLGGFGTHSGGFYVNGSPGGQGQAGSAGAGGGGGGGGGGQVGVLSGCSGGGGGGGGAGGQGGFGGFGGGGSFGVYITSNGSNGQIEHCEVFANAPGNGGSGGSGGRGGRGGFGGPGGDNSGNPARGKGGNGGNGRPGGDGGIGGNGRAGQAQRIFWDGSGTIPVAQDSTYDFSIQDTIYVDNVNCTNRTVRFVDSSAAFGGGTNWNFDFFGTNAFPQTSTNNPGNTQYLTIGRYSIQHGSAAPPYDEFRGFHNIASTAASAPDILHTGNPLGPDTAHICLGDFANFSSSDNGDTIRWNFHGAIPNPGNVQSIGSQQFNITGFFPVELYISNDCCGDTPRDTLWLFVDPYPVVSDPPDDVVCQGNSTLIVLAGFGSTDTVVWTPTTGMVQISLDSVLVSPATTTTYLATVATKRITNGETRYTCPVYVDAEISVVPSISTSISATPISCNGGTSTITVNASGGGGVLNYSWTGGNSASFPSNTDVVGPAIAGTYNVTVSDGMGCDAVTSIVINQPPPVTASISNQNNVTCRGDATGDATAQASGGDGGPYSFVWDANTGGQFGATATGLAAGIYCVTASDGSGCTDFICVTITEPAAAVSASALTINDETCNGLCDGSGQAGGFGGTSPFTFLWDAATGNQTNSIVTALCAGSYTVTATDAVGCEATATLLINSPPPLTLFVTNQNNVACFGDATGDARVQASGGTIGAGYQYLWDAAAGGQTTQLVTGLATGIYCAQVTDGNGCQTNTCVTITEPAAILSIATISSTSVTCNGGFDGTATATGSGGTPYTNGYQFFWSPSGQTTATATSLPGGKQYVTIVDSLGCTNIDSIVVAEPPPLTAVNFGQTNPSCFGGCDGDATVNGLGGTGGLTFLWDAATGNQNTATATGLCAGNYTATITDANGCTDSLQFLINNPPILTVIADTIISYNGAMISCNGANDAQVTAIATGGTSSVGYNYAWDVPAATQTVIGLGAGQYIVTATDDNGCEAYDTIDIEEPIILTAIPTNIIHNTCFGDSTGQADGSGTGGTGAYTFLWSNGQTDLTVTGLKSADNPHALTITDANGCVDSASFNINEGAPVPAPGFLVFDSTLCEGEDIFLISFASASVFYWVGPNGWTSNVSNPSILTATVSDSGLYTLSIDDPSGCRSADTTFNVHVAGPPTKPTISGGPFCAPDTIVLHSDVFCDSTSWRNLGSGGTLVGTNDSLAIPPISSHYQTTIWEMECHNLTTGCFSVSDPIFVQVHGQLLEPNINQSGPVCFGDSVVLIAPAVLGATSEWFADSTLTQSFGVMDTLVVYNITVDSTIYLVQTQTSTGCTSPRGSTTVLVNPLPTALVPADFSVCEGDTIFLTTTSTGPNFEWSHPNGFISNQPNTFITPAVLNDSGYYTLTVMDNNGCTAADSVFVTVHELPGVLLSNALATDVCDGDTIFMGALGSCDLFEWESPSGDTILTTSQFLDVDSSSTNYLPGVWLVYCVDTVKGCKSLPTVVDTINILPRPPFPTVTTSGPVCFGDSVHLSATPMVGVNYAWVELDTTLITTGNPAAIANITSDTQFVLIVGMNGCTSFDTVNVAAYPIAPTAIPPSDTSVCIGDLLALFSPTPANAYIWTLPSSAQVTTDTLVLDPVNGGDGGPYSLEIIDTNGCPGPDTTFFITVNNPPPPPVVISNSPVCEGDTLILTISSAACPQYEWTGASGVSFIAGDTIVIPFGHPDYGPNWEVVCVDSLIGCNSVPTNHVMNIKPIPVVPPMFSNSPVCVGDSVQLSAAFVGGATYTWYAMDSVTVIDSTNTIFVQNITTDSAFILVVNVNGCENSDSIQVQVHSQLPQPSVPDSLAFCEDDTIKLTTSTGAPFYEWTGPSAFFSTDKDPQLFPAKPANDGIYTLHTIDSNGCKSPDTTVVVTVHPPVTSPTIISIQNNPCDGDSIIITRTSAPCDSMSWITPFNTYLSGVDTLSIVPPNANYVDGDWFLLCVDTLTGCQAISNPITSTIRPVPATPIISQTGPVCNGDSVNLSMALVAGANYQWFAPNGDSIGAGSMLTKYNLTNDTLFYGVVIVNGCSAFDFTSIVVNPLPATPDIGAVSDSVCASDSIQLLTTTAAAVYNWSGPNGFMSNDQNPVIRNLSSINTGTYHLFVVDGNGCVSADTTIFIEVFTNPTKPSIVGTLTVCEGDTLRLIEPGCQLAEWTSPNNTNYYTSNLASLLIGPGSPDYITGDWTVMCIDTTTGCVSPVSDPERVTVHPLPIPINAFNNGPVCVHGSTIVGVPAQPFATYIWSTDSLLTDSIDFGTIVVIDSIISDTTLYVEVTSQFGCQAWDSTQITVFPTLGTPNIEVLDSLICEGDSIAFSSSTTASAYHWTGPNGFSSNAQSFVIQTASLADSGLYTLVVEDANGCLSPDTSISVHVNIAPYSGLTITGPSNVCFGDSLILETVSTICDSFIWVGPQQNQGGGTPNINQTLALPGNPNYITGSWQLICHDTLTGCSALSNPVFVTIDSAPPTPIATNNGPVCNGDSVLLSTANLLGGTIGWYSDTLLAAIGSGPNLAFGTISQDSTFFVQYNLNGCLSSFGATTVTLHPLSVPPNMPDSIEVCAGDTIFLGTSTNGLAYSWSGPGFSSLDQNPVIPIAANTHVGNYVLTMIDSNGCVAPNNMTYVAVNAAPVPPTITYSTPLCAGDTLFLTTSAGSCPQSEWVGPTGTSIVSNTPDLDIDPLHPDYQNGDWQMFCIDTLTGCASPSNILTVNVTTAPTAGTITSSSPVCFGDSVDISTTSIVGASSYFWEDIAGNNVGNTATINVLNITSDTTFYLFVTTANGCTFLVDSVDVLLSPTLAAPPIQSNAPICEGQPLQLSTAFAQGYNWTGPNGFTSTAQNPIIAPTSMADSGLYTLSVLNANGCPSLDSVANIIINATPAAPVAFGPGTICDGDTLYLTSTATACDSAVWIGPAGNAVSGANVAIAPNSPDYLAGAWEVHCISLPSGCSTSSSSITVTINPKPNPVVVNSGPICAGEPVTLSTSFVLGTTYLWSSDSLMTDTLGQGFFVVVNDITTDSTFYLVATPFFGCPSSPIPTTVVVHPATGAPNILPDFTVCEGDDIQLSSSSLTTAYNWNGPNGFNSTAANPVITNSNLQDSGLYTLTIIDANGCESDTASVYVSIDPAPASPTIPLLYSYCEGDTMYLDADSTSAHCDSVVWVGPNGENYAVPGRNIALVPGDTNYIGGIWYLKCIDTLTGCSSNSNISLVFLWPMPDTQAVYNSGPVCIGGDVTLSTPAVGGFVSYAWFADSLMTDTVGVGQNPTVPNITTDTTFYLVISNAVGCPSRPMPTFVQVLPPGPAPSIPADFDVCEGEPIVMSTTTNASFYYWSSTNGFVDSAQNPIVTNAATINDTGTYSLIVIDSNGCISSDTSLYVHVNILGPAPTISAVNPTICDGDTLFLNSSGACGQSQWIGPNGSSPLTLGTAGGGNVLWTIGNSTAIPPGNPNYLGGDWYTICIDTTTGCRIHSDTINISILPAPIIAAALNNGPICIGDSANLTVTANAGGTTGGLTITWYDDPNMTAASQIDTGASIFVANITTTSTFYVNVMNSSGCSSIDSTTVLVNPLPAAPTVPADMILCAGDAIVLSTSTVANAYGWSGPNAYSSTLQTPAAILSTVQDSGYYSLVVVDTNGCQSPSDSVHVTINALPLAPSVSNNGPSCLGDSVNLTATLVAGATYTWYQAPLGTPIDTGQTIIITNLSFADTGAYYVVVTLNGCSTSSLDTTTVSVLGIGTGSAFAGFDQNLCGQDSTSLAASPSNNPSTVGTWTTSSSAIIQNAGNPNSFVSNLDTGANVFYWTLVNSNCNTSTVDSVIITVTAQSTDSALTGNDLTGCGLTTATLSGNSPTLSTGLWIQSPSQAGTGAVINNSSDPNSGVSGLIPGNQYVFVWQFTNGLCGVHSVDTMTIDISIAPADNAFAGLDVIACGQDTVTLAALSSSIGTGIWTTPSSATIIDSIALNTQVTDLTQDTTMFIWTLSNGICSDYSADTVLVLLSGASPIANADNFAVIAGQSNTINVLPNDNLTSNWDVFINTPTANGQLINLNNGLFDVILGISDTFNQSFVYELCNPNCPNSCDTALVLLTVTAAGDCEPPNIFTPNGDGVNDEFVIPCLNGTVEAWMIVFNRWGDEVYQSDKYTNQWDGTHNGQSLPDGTYFYILRVGNGENVQGSVEIRR